MPGGLLKLPFIPGEFPGESGGDDGMRAGCAGGVDASESEPTGTSASSDPFLMS